MAVKLEVVFANEMALAGTNGALWLVARQEDADALTRSGVAATALLKMSDDSDLSTWTDAKGTGDWSSLELMLKGKRSFIAMPPWLSVDTGIRKVCSAVHGNLIARGMKCMVLTLPDGETVATLLKTYHNDPQAVADSLIPPPAPEPLVKKVIVMESEPLDEQLDLMQRTINSMNKKNLLLEVPGGSLGFVRHEHNEWSYQELGIDALNAFVMPWFNPLGTDAKSNVVQRSMLSKELVKAYIGTHEWPGVPRVIRMACAPVIRPDLTVRWESGYDEPSETYVTDPAEEPEALKKEITHDDVVYARRYLLGWFNAFAFEQPESRADCLGLALTPMLLSYIKDACIPGGLLLANRPGSGKTQLAQLIALMGSGTQIAAESWPKSDAMKTSITTVLKDGDRQAVLYDNVKTNMDDASLEAVLTSRWWSDRRFHTQSSIRLPNNLLWLFTKNSPAVSPDMLRRLILVPLNLDKTPTVWNPLVLAEAKQHIRMIRTALTMLIKYWAQLGAPAGSVSMSGFEVWSETVSGILEAAGVVGFSTSRESAKDIVYTEDEDKADMISRVGRVMAGTEKWSASQLWDKVNGFDGIGGATDNDRRAVREWFSSGAGGTGSPMSVGRKLADLVGKQLATADCALEKVSGTGQGGRYIVVSNTRTEVVWDAMRGIADNFDGLRLPDNDDDF